MAQAKDEVGNVYGRLTVVKRAGSRSRKAMWECLCTCGKVSTVSGVYLRNGVTQSCGCLRAERAVAATSTHGMTGTPVHRAWRSMRARCYIPSATGYSNYGGRGIRVCPRWNKFDNFYKDVGNPPFSGATLERLDVNGDYAPGNCVWASRVEQSRNTRRTRNLTYDGRTQCLKDWATEFGISYGVLLHRVSKLGWPLQDALTRPLRRTKKGESSDN